MFEERDGGSVSEGDEGTQAPEGGARGCCQVEAVLRGAQPAVLRVGGGGSGVARGVVAFLVSPGRGI